LLNSLGDPTLTVSFSTPAEARTVPFSWLTWSSPPFSEISTPRVAFVSASTQILTFSQPVTTFGVELEPNRPGVFTATATFLQGLMSVGTVTLDVSGSGGARLFAGTTNDQSFTSVQLEIAAEASGFAFAQVRYGGSAIPEPTGFLLVGVGLIGLLGYRWGRMGS
jgi:hypothetical protein